MHENKDAEMVDLMEPGLVRPSKQLHACFPFH